MLSIAFLHGYLKEKGPSSFAKPASDNDPVVGDLHPPASQCSIYLSFLGRGK